MPYFLYERVWETQTYKQHAPIKIFGNTEGLIYNAIKDELPRTLEQRRGFTWVRTSSELLSAGGYDPDRHIAIIDVDPDREEGILLGIIRGMAGYTEQTWTPFIIFLDIIEKEGSVYAKQEIQLNEAAGNRACDVLYAQGGWEEKYRGFIPSHGSVTGALPGAVAFRYFTKVGLEWIENGIVTGATRYD